jgi:hypothetical protein
LGEAVEIIKAYGKEIVALLVPCVAWALNYFFRAKAKIHFATPHQFVFLVQEPLRDAQGTVIQPSQTVYTRSLLIRNAGKVPVTGIEIVFNWKPMCMNIWPPRHYDELIEPDNRSTIKFDSLAPGEYFGLELLSVNNQLPEALTVRSDQCVAENIAMYPQPFVPAWKRRIAVGLLFAGLGLTVYILILLLQFVLLQTPLGIYGTP